MEPIQASLKKWMKDNKNFQENFSHLRSAIVNDSQVKQLLLNNPQLDSKDIDRNLMKLYEFISQSKNCADCPVREECKNILPGYTPYLQVDGKTVRLSYEKCYKKIQHDEQEKQKSLIQSLYMPKDILNATFTDLDHTDKRREAITESLRYLQSIGTDKQADKGMYFYGPFGVGKTHFLGAIANELAKKRIATMIIYMPEFVREIKASLKDDSLNQKVERFKTIPVLMLDDIGAESQSAWFRDEILGSILQYRMMEKLPVFFTSNYSLEQLENHLATTTRGDIEKVKAGRIIERIKQVSREVPLFGVNRRE
ncbi:primosomal protein DnaI [Sediminibacillus dalangtanensis]|uniref:Primosomal protein DnaI n=1 Tax=Sediminibacillus dalangtanensis TaxID=2729421 RepID=A0ABX7VSV7_9BACI|nr:primosomal protein DnaI [Sediminibacillus dalangtanensis]QTN00038.1 primosomal protein DnaI [Sediminibacillus dalangtanensis]